MSELKELEELINNTENGVYSYDYEGQFPKGEIYKYYIKIGYGTELIELSNFLKELEWWRIKNNIPTYKIIFETLDYNGNEIHS